MSGDKDVNDFYDLLLGEDVEPVEGTSEKDEAEEVTLPEGTENKEDTSESSSVDFDTLKSVLGDDIFEEHDKDPIQERKQELEAYELSLDDYEENVNSQKAKLSETLALYNSPKYVYNDKPFYAMNKDELKEFLAELSKQDNVPEAIEISNTWDKINKQAKEIFDADLEVKNAKLSLSQQKHVLEWDMAEKNLLKSLPELSNHKDELVQNVKVLLEKLPKSKQASLTYDEKVNLIKQGIKNSSFIKSKREAFKTNPAASQTQPPDIAANNTKAKTNQNTNYEEKRKQLLKMNSKQLAKVPEDEFWEAVLDGAV